VPGNVGTHDLGRQVLTGPVAAKRQQRLFGLPLLVDVDPVGLERVGLDLDDEVAATRRTPRLYDRFE